MAWCTQNTWTNSDTTEETSPTNQETVNEEESFNATMKEVFKKWKTVTCDFSMNMEGVPAKWTFYVEGKNMRYSTSTTSDGIAMSVDVIVKDGYSYSRTNMQPNQWFKMKEPANDDQYEDGEAEERNQTADFVCKKGVPSGIFELPANINFKEFAGM